MSISGQRIRRRWRSARWKLLRATRAEVTVPTRQGLLSVFTRDRVIGKSLYLAGEYQLDLSRRVLTFLREQGRIPPRGEGAVLDVGANNGVISIGMLVNKEFQAAVGIEPEPDNFRLLERNVDCNRLTDRYTALCVAASDRRGELRFEISGTNCGDHRVRVSDSAAEPQRRAIRVPAAPLDELVAQLPAATSSAISVVWIDVQGHEGHAFAGGEQLFRRPVPVIAEIWPYGIERSGMSVAQFCAGAAARWSSYWVWRRCGRFVRYPSESLVKFIEELGNTGEFDDVIFTHD